MTRAKRRENERDPAEGSSEGGAPPHEAAASVAGDAQEARAALAKAEAELASTRDQLEKSEALASLTHALPFFPHLSPPQISHLPRHIFNPLRSSLCYTPCVPCIIN